MDTQQIQQIIDMVQNGLNDLSAKLGVTLPHIWEVIVRQQYVEAAQSFVGLIITSISLYLCLRFTKNHWEEDTPEYIEIPVIIITAISAIFLFISIIGSIDGIGAIINPEYYAMQDMAEFISNK